MNNSCAILKKSIVWCIIFCCITLAKQFFHFGQTLFCRIFLQDNQVASNFCTCIFSKQIIWQSNNRNQITILHQRPAYRFVFWAI